MTPRICRTLRRATPWAAVAVAAVLAACGPSEEEIRLQELTGDLDVANATIDSLNYTIESSNLLIDEMRARVDSLQQVDTKLLESVQRLNREVKQWQQLAADRARMNEQLQGEIERLKREKQGDTQTIARLRSQADSVNAALLSAHTNIRRQEDHIKRMEMELSQSRDEVALLREAETSVRVYVATEAFLKESGYLETDRIFGRAFKKTYKQAKKLDPSDPRVRLVPINQPFQVDGEIQTLADRFGELDKGDAYRSAKVEGGGREVTFRDELLAGTDVLVILKD